MRTLLFSILFLSSSIGGNCQVQSASDFDTTAFLNQVIKDKRSHIYLYKSIHPHTATEIRKSIAKGRFVKTMEDGNGNNISDSIILSESEITQLLQQLNTFQNFRWTEHSSNNFNLDRLKLINSDPVSNLSDGAIRYQIAPPLLFRNGEYCFFYYDYSCGPLCGQGQLAIYKKERGEWKRWWTLFGWNS